MIPSQQPSSQPSAQPVMRPSGQPSRYVYFVVYRNLVLVLLICPLTVMFIMNNRPQATIQ